MRPGGRAAARARLRRAVPLLLWLGLQAAPAQGSGSAVVVLDEAHFAVEVARTPAEHRRGLAGRASLAPGRGMLFVYDPARPVRFWMRGMRFALDILYFDAAHRLVAVYAAVPACTISPCRHYPSPGAVRYVLELTAGTAARLGALPGQRLRVLAE